MASDVVLQNKKIHVVEVPQNRQMVQVAKISTFNKVKNSPKRSEEQISISQLLNSDTPHFV